MKEEMKKEIVSASKEILSVGGAIMMSFGTGLAICCATHKISEKHPCFGLMVNLGATYVLATKTSFFQRLEKLSRETVNELYDTTETVITA